jgi:hypothetical protein
MDLTAHVMSVLSPNLCPKHPTIDYWKYLDDTKNSKHGRMTSMVWKQFSTYARYGRSRKKKATGANVANLPLMRLGLLHHIQSESAAVSLRFARRRSLNFSQCDCDSSLGAESCGMVLIRDRGGFLSCVGYINDYEMAGRAPGLGNARDG